MQARAGFARGAGEVILWKYGSSPESDEDVTNLRDLDLGLNVSISTFFGLSSKAVYLVSKEAEDVLLWNSFLSSSLS